MSIFDLQHDTSIVYVTCRSLDRAGDTTRTVVEKYLAACINISDGMRSVFGWEGWVQESEEVLLILKIRRACLDKLSARVMELRSFDVPCVAEILLGTGNAGYFAWIAVETSGGGA